MSIVDLRAMRQLADVITDRGHACDFLSPHAALTARLRAYSGGFGVRTYQVMTATFPRTSGALSERWHELGRRYVQDEGLENLNLNDLGRGFPGFLRRSDVAASVCELASLEWLKTETARQPRRPGPALEALATWDETTVLELQPHVSTMQVRYAVEVESAHEGQPLEAPGVLSIVRGRASVLVQRLSEEQVRFLSGVRARWSLGDLVERGALGPSLADLLRWAVECELIAE